MSYLAVFIASLLGSAHCGAMCGGFVALVAADCASPDCSKSSLRVSTQAQALYHLGRLLTYLTLGFLSATLGSYLNDFGAFLGVQRLATILVALLLVVWGAEIVFERSVLGGRQANIGAQVYQRLAKIINALSRGRASLRPFFVGTLTTLIPCGWLYSFVVIVAASGSPFTAMFLMFLFWLGTLPVLLGVAGAGHMLLARYGRVFPRLSGVLLIVAGVFAFSGRAVPMLETLLAEEGAKVPACHSEGDSSSTFD